MKCPNCGSCMRRSSKNNSVVVYRCVNCGFKVNGRRKERKKRGKNKYDRYYKYSNLLEYRKEE